MTNEMTELERIFKNSFKNEIYDILDTTSKDFIIDLKELNSVGEVSFDKPLDAIAYDLYKDENLYYILQYYNDIVDPLELTNTYIKYPAIEDIRPLIMRYSND